MRIMLHESYERKLIALSESKGLTPSQLVKQLIQESYRVCTDVAQGDHNDGTQEKE